MFKKKGNSATNQPIGIHKLEITEGLEADNPDSDIIGKRIPNPEDQSAGDQLDEDGNRKQQKQVLTSTKPLNYITSQTGASKTFEDPNVQYKSGASGTITKEYAQLKETLEREEAAEKLKPDDRTMAQRMKEQNEKSSKYFVSIGPARISNTVKHTNTIDYNPSRCKDFFQAGYCVFGDSCIFIHDRCDYKFGWQIDKEYEAKQKKKQERRQKRLEAIIAQQDPHELGLDSTDSENEDTLLGPAVYAHIDPVCPSCKQDYKTPILLVCNHILCESCAGKEYAKTGKCPKCSKRMSGVFNTGAKVLERALQEKKERKEKYQEAKREKKRSQNHELPTYLRENTTYQQRGEQGDTDDPTVVSEEQINQAFARIAQQQALKKQ